MKTSYYINDKEYVFSVEDSSVFRHGKDEILSRKDSDITYGQPWYDQGYSEVDFLDADEFQAVKDGLYSSIKKIISDELAVDVTDFSLEKYHTFVKSDKEHFKIVSKTRDLFADDFNFPVMKLIPRLGNILGFGLTDIDSTTKEKLHIIVRINRPQSNDFNPPHKDIYEGVDNDSYLPRFVNFWIPIAGVTMNSSLPIAPESHKLNENLVCRTFDGGQIEGNKYRVRMIKSWDGESALVRSTVKDGQVLIFSGHLIHGLAVNNETDSTRVALEFRLFKTED